MTLNSRTAVTLCGLALFFLAGCAAFDAPQPIPDTYLLFAGTGSSHFSSGWAYNGTGARAFPACLYSHLNDRTQAGQTLLHGWLDERSKLEVNFELFNISKRERTGGPESSPNEERGKILVGTKLDGKLGTDGPYFPPTEARLAASGEAILYINGDTYPLASPEGSASAETWQALFFLAANGFRDNATKAILAEDGVRFFDPARPEDARREPGDLEAHLVLRQTKAADAAGVAFSSPDEDGAGNVRLNNEYARDYAFNNSAYGGSAQFVVSLQTSAPSMAATQLTFKFFSPNGARVANVTMGGGDQTSERREVTFSLAEFGVYRIEVRGKMLLSRYEISGTLNPPPGQLFTFWWEDPLESLAATDLYDTCVRDQGSDSHIVPIPVEVSTGRPPGINLKLVVVGVAGALLVGLYLVKLAMDAAASSAFRRTARKK